MGNKELINKEFTDMVEVNKDVKVEAKPILIGTATCDLIDADLKAGEETFILKDQGDEWLTENGVVSKLYLLLKQI